MHETKIIKLSGDLASIVDELLKQVPDDVEVVVVMINNDSLTGLRSEIEISGRLLPVSFTNLHQPGDIWLKFGPGEKESFGA